MSGFLLDVLKILTGYTVVRQLLMQLVHRAPMGDQQKSYAASPGELAAVLATQGSLLAGLALLGQGWLYVFFWILPLATLTKTFTFVRNLGEHIKLRDGADPELSRFRTIRCGAVEAFFLAPMGFNYHAEHHLYPGIPYHHLAEAHALLSRRGEYDAAVDVAPSYLSVIFGRD